MQISERESHTIKGTFIDLFAGCGGLSLGLMLSGWRGLFAIEKEKNAFETLRYNLLEGKQIGYSWPIWLSKKPHRISFFIKKYEKKLLGLRGKVDLIVGGPPCQGFSLAGRRKKEDPRNLMFKHYAELVSLLKPKLLLIENVRGITVGHGNGKNEKKVGRPSKAFSERISETIESLGYYVYSNILMSSEFGVPQLRPRYIMLGISKSYLTNKADINPFDIVKSKRSEFLSGKGLPVNRPITVREAISDLQVKGKELIECQDSPRFKQITYSGPETNYQLLLHGSLNGTPPNSLRLANHRERTIAKFSEILETCRRGVGISAREKKRLGIKKHCLVLLDGSKPSHTITTLPDDLLHYSEPRILTVRENARLQSFPDWFEFKGKYTTGGERRVKECPRYTQVGNAVPPFLAEALGQALSTILQETVAHKTQERILTGYQIQYMDRVTAFK
jgi:DNA (cytosine-5)-methyltransferase 1